jgi:hypothetical protein
MRLNIVHYLVTLNYFIYLHTNQSKLLWSHQFERWYQVLKITKLTWPRVKLCDGARESSEAQDGAV